MKRKHIVRSAAGIILASVLLVCAGMESMASVKNAAPAKGDEEEEKYIYINGVGTVTLEEGVVYADFLANLDMGTKFTVLELPGASKQVIAIAEKEWHGEGLSQGAVKCELYYPGDEEMLFLGSIGSASLSEPVRYDSDGIYCKSRDKIECYRINKKGDGLEVAESAQIKDAVAYRMLSQKYDSADFWFLDEVDFQYMEEVEKTINSLDKKYRTQIQSGKVPSYCGVSGWDGFLEKRHKAEEDSIFGTIGEIGDYTIYGICDDEGQAMLVENPDGGYVWIEAPVVSVHDEQPQFSIIEGEDGEEYLAIMTYVLHGTGYRENTLIIVDGDYAYHLLAGEYLPTMCEYFTVTGQGTKWSLEIDGKTAGEFFDTKGDDTSACTIGSCTEIEIKKSQIHVISEMIVFSENNMVGDYPGVALDLTLDYSGEGNFEAVGCKYHKGLV